METLNRGVLEPGLSDSTNNLSLIYGNKSGIETDGFVTEDSVLNTKIAMLPDSSWVKVTLTFATPTNWNDLKKFMASHEAVNFYNAILDRSVEVANEVGIRLAPVSANNFDSLTAMPKPYSSDFIKKIEKDYPQLLQQVTNTTSEDEVKQFLTSNIQYLLDHFEDDLEQSNSPKVDNSNRVSSHDQLKLLIDQIDQMQANELLFSKIQVSLSKDQFATFVTDQEFFYATLDDLAVFSMSE
jgi:hypothetical protein